MQATQFTTSGDWLELLLVEESTQGLCADQAEELRRLASESGMSEVERESWAATAALCELAIATEKAEGLAPTVRAEPARAVPHSLERRLQDLAREAARTAAAGNSFLEVSTPSDRPSDQARVLDFGAAPREPLPLSSNTPFRATASGGGTLPWALAAAAAMICAVALWFAFDARRALRTGEHVLAADFPETVSQAPALEDRLATAPDVVELTFSATDDPAAAGSATGRVLWSAQLQQGQMRIAGLAANDPSAWQYQLWIFDAARDERYPVDGGVFDIDQNGEVVVPIHAKISVERPVLFAVTVERPGGVVVSSRERIVLAAQAA